MDSSFTVDNPGLMTQFLPTTFSPHLGEAGGWDEASGTATGNLQQPSNTTGVGAGVKG